MPTLFVAHSKTLALWAGDVGLGKNLYRVGITDRPVKEELAEEWAGVADWALAAEQEVEGLTEEQALERLSRKEKPVDPKLYPRIRGAVGLFRVQLKNVENHIVVAQALANQAELKVPKLKPADYGAYLIKNALK